MVVKKRAGALKPDTIRLGLRHWFVGEEHEGEQRAFCPVCEDPSSSSSPSASINPENGYWNCLKGNHGGNIVDLVKFLKERDGFDIRSARLQGAAGKSEKSAEPAEKRSAPPSAAAVNTWHAALLKNTDALDSLMEERGITMETIEEREIGWDSKLGRYTIPVYDEDGDLQNVRKYKLNAGPKENKMLNSPGYGEGRIYCLDQLQDTAVVVLVEGEMDAFIVQQMGIPAVTSTSGAGVWKPEWTKHFEGKTVYICYDSDDAGNKGAIRAASALKSMATAVYIMHIPLEKEGADITDYIVGEKKTVEDFHALMSLSAAAGSRGGKPLSDMPVTGTKMSLVESMADTGDVGNTIELTVSITGKTAEPYTAPRHIIATCDMSKGAVCEVCPLFAANGQVEMEVFPHDPVLVEFVDVPTNNHVKILRGITGARCGDRVQFDVTQQYRIEELAVQTSIDERTDDLVDTPARRQVWSVGTYRSAVNEKARLVGTNVADPKTGVLRFQAWINQKVDLDIDKFKLTPEIRAVLDQFRPDEGQSPLDKAMEIASDMAENVTLIVGRDLLHLGMDLVYHSPIAFKVHDTSIDKGWLEMMVVGDTRTGKSEIANRLIKHYNAGRLVSCEGVTFAGLIGGVQQIAGRWHMTWGAVPMNDRRLVVLDEVSGMSEKNVIQQMSSVRSAGIAQITKIASESTSARTRLIWITNPQDGRFLSDNRMGGIGALRTVIPNNEDIARFDFVMAAARGDVASSDINKDNTKAHYPQYGSEACEMLVKWAWSLTRDQIKINEQAINLANKFAEELGDMYSPNPPLIQAENVRFKILRIAVALAARTFSVLASGKLVVNAIHVEDAVRFLNEIYGHDALGYRRLSDDANKRAKTSESKIGAARSLLEVQEDVYATLHMNRQGEFRVRDFSEFRGMSPENASQIVAKLNDWGLTEYKGQGVFLMTRQLIDLLNDIQREKEGL